MNKTTPVQRQSIDVQFLQDLINQTNLELKVSSLSEQSYRSLVCDESPVLDWLSHYHLSCFSGRAFHIGVQRFKQPRPGLLVGVYDSRVGRQHTLLLEPLDGRAAQAMTERLMSVITYIALYFLSTYPNSIGVYLVDPPKAFLSHYGLYGYKVLDSWHEVPVLFEMLLDEELDLLAD
ncbi:hypothetical protein [Vibrio coralliilyticus]|uniref:hypothetical protein n=1 Tax=Vibrio coralliilyticus TaxID=190893 RepID=UPI000BAAC33E|nr:hypothetical protein [Vibrio coralliilyticus]NOI59375.1 hypothetical protein [Vibrio coralliilyticus]PAT66030.1 hypothetical protein CKA27_21240 [Vibrio coralliilyticus]